MTELFSKVEIYFVTGRLNSLSCIFAINVVVETCPASQCGVDDKDCQTRHRQHPFPSELNQMPAQLTRKTIVRRVSMA